MLKIADTFIVIPDTIDFHHKDDYTKTRNYWKYLKAKLKKENSQVVSVTTQLRILATAGLHECNDAKSDKK